MNREILEELDKIDSDSKDQIKSPDDISNDFSKLKVVHSWLYWFAVTSLIVITLVTIGEIPLLILNRKPEKLWINLVVTIIVMCWSFGIYFILFHRGVTSYEYDDAYYYSGKTIRRLHEVTYVNDAMLVFALIICTIDFFLFYGADMTMLTGSDNLTYYKDAMPILLAISILVPALIVPILMQFINRSLKNGKDFRHFDEWVKMNGISKVNYIDKIDYNAEDFSWKQVSSDLELNPDVLIFDNSSENKSKEQIDLYNKIQIKIVKELLVVFNSNNTKRFQYLKQITTKRNKQNRLYIKKTIRNSNNVSRIKKIDQKNQVLSLLATPYFEA
ncbi:hypothetical protein [Mesoplasma lactucae]|uniref:Uncharacterized protein n=1 Tax=Mesoplasma lactucae ATCC 49193 TaxID=81460 RepID=A0A291IRL7_9MOLU|nr:hypothetical protein [Mesoplasma lactucae]ATG97374.1 hypothetical protein CP520_01200 [Mesoplasma lactucae ATCC 49193]ATZ20174.1 hypothetical protein MLACT_v1c03530 [Mesoplasma lactucae ATCC 49193]MCL8216923.1 hypothetical protein [Mesoplasma lactucae ATCC 49193]